MPCMKKSGAGTPSKTIGSSNNIRTDISAKGSYNNLDSV